MQDEHSINWYAKTEIVDAIQSMSEDEMRSLLIQLSNEKTWIAVLKYIQLRFQTVQQSLRYLDVSKEAANISKTQGFLNGITDLPDAVGNVVVETNKSLEEAAGNS